MSDIVNDRVNAAQALLQQRAERLNKLVKSTRGKKVSDEFTSGVNILAEMINNQSETINRYVFEEPKTAMEQMRNLQLTTGAMDQTPAQFFEPITQSMDTILTTLEKMVR